MLVYSRKPMLRMLGRIPSIWKCSMFLVLMCFIGVYFYHTYSMAIPQTRFALQHQSSFSSNHNSPANHIQDYANPPLNHVTTAVDKPLNHVTTAADKPLNHVTTAADTPLNHVTTAADKPLNHVTTAVADKPLNHVTTAADKPLNHATAAADKPLSHNLSVSEMAVPLCTDKRNHSAGKIAVNQTEPGEWELTALALLLQPGGHWEPENCRQPKRLIIIVPMRNRESQLNIFLKHMHPFLQRQHVNYTIYVSEQSQNGAFNKGMIMNAGFVAALRDRTGSDACYVFHDIDLLPENDANLYQCDDKPRHMDVIDSNHQYKKMYSSAFGGVTSFTAKHFQKVNGYPNNYFGWGMEDDEMSARVQKHFGRINNHSEKTDSYTMVKHKHSTVNTFSRDMYNQWKKLMDKNGLSDMSGYRLITTEKRPLYTWIYGAVNRRKILQNLGINDPKYYKETT